MQELVWVGHVHLGRVGDAPGQSLRGSSDLHAFVDTLAWLGGGGKDKLELHLEHRSAPTPEPLRLRLASAPDGSRTHLEVVGAPAGLAGPTEEDLSKRIIELLGRSGQPVNRAGLRETLRVNNQRLGDALIALENQRLIRRAKDGWELPVRLSAGDVQMTLM